MKTIGIDSEKLEREMRVLVDTFSKQASSSAKKHFAIYLAICSTIAAFAILFFFSLTIWLSPLLTALSLSATLIALFGGYIYLRYASIHRAERYAALAGSFVKCCGESIPYHPENPFHHTTLGIAAAMFADNLRGKEYTQLSFKYLPKFLLTPIENLSCFLFWKDFFVLREMLLNTSIEHYLHLVRSDPIHLTYHSQLANAYVLLSRLYKNPSLDDNREDKRWIPKGRASKKMEESYRHATERAIEEFKIISSYAPDDPWVLSQLAISYRDLGLPFEEINACESLLRLCPSETETLHRLGSLYFKLGANAKGLEVYRQLSHIDCSLAGSLISQYGLACLYTEKVSNV